MSLEVYRIPEWPYNKTTWVEFGEASSVAGVDGAVLRRICGTIGAKIIRHGYALARPGGNAHDQKHAEFIDFGVLGASASWKQLMSAKASSDSQGTLF